MEVAIILEQMIQIFIMMFLGFLIFRLKIIDEVFLKRMSTVIVNVTIPALILSSVMSESMVSDPHLALIVLIASFIIQFIMPFPAFLITRLLRVPKENTGIYLFATTFSNVGFMGYPITQALLGETGLFYASLFNMMFNVALFLFGPQLMAFGTDTKEKFSFKNLITPGIICSLLALIIYFSGIKTPDVIYQTCKSMGAVTTPMAMIVVGGNLAKMNLREVFRNVRIYPYSLIKQLAIPIIFWLILKNLISDRIVLNVLIIMISMPVANNTVLFATEYDKNTDLASALVFVTTLFCIFSIPFVSLICSGL